MNHIDEWHKINKRWRDNAILKKGRAGKKERDRIEDIKGYLTERGAENITTNGYVWDFDYKGMSGHFCDQENRLVGSIHRPFFSEEDEKSYHDSRLTRDSNADEFQGEWYHKGFVIYGRYRKALSKVLHLIEDAITARMQR